MKRYVITLQIREVEVDDSLVDDELFDNCIEVCESGRVVSDEVLNVYETLEECESLIETIPNLANF